MLLLRPHRLALAATLCLAPPALAQQTGDPATLAYDQKGLIGRPAYGPVADQARSRSAPPVYQAAVAAIAPAQDELTQSWSLTQNVRVGLGRHDILPAAKRATNVEPMRVDGASHTRTTNVAAIAVRMRF